MSVISDRFRAELSNKEYRDAYIARRSQTAIAYQIKALRESRNWSQATLAARLGKQQSAISRLENPEYGKHTHQTLLELASAFDVALLIRFVSHDEFVRRTNDLSPQSLVVSGFDRNCVTTVYNGDDAESEISKRQRRRDKAPPPAPGGRETDKER